MIKKNLFTFIFYGLLSLFFLRGIIFSSGIISGGDWGLPLTFSQADQYFKSGFYTWTDTSLFGIQQFFLNGLPFRILIGFLAKLGITGDIYTKLFLILAFVFAAFNMFLFCRFLNCGKKAAFFGGLLYITLPFFFNYAAMGWLFVLFSMGILPLALIFFIKSVKEEKVVYSILTGVLYFLAMMQSQSLFWYPLVFLSLIIFLVEDRKSLLSYIKSFLVVFLVFLGLNAYLWLPLFFGGGSGVLGTELGLSTVSLGTWARLSYLNISKVWGGLFNYQYETSYPQILAPLSFLLPILACSSLIFVRKKKILLSFAVLSFVPLILFSLGPKSIAELPFSDIFRDIARFLVLSSFSYVVMATLFLDFLFKQKKKYLNVVGVVLVILLIIVAYPFWAGELFGKQKQEYDIRLRTYNFPQGYFDLENNLKAKKEDAKVLYLPIGGSLNINDDKRFYGPFKEISDIFTGYSPKPGAIGISDRGMGSATDFIFKFQERIDTRQFEDLSNWLSLMAVKYLAVRENVDYPLGVSGRKTTDLLNRQPEMIYREKWETISLFENKNFLPHFYIPQNTIYSPNDIEILPDIVGFDDYEIRSAIFVADNALNADNADREDTDKADEEGADNAGKDADKADEENADNTDKRARITRIEGADEIFVKGEEKEDIEKILNQVQDDGEGEIFYPYVKHEPGSLKWKAALLKEKYNEWKARKEVEKLIEKKLFYGNKRVNEIMKFQILNSKFQIPIFKNYDLTEMWLGDINGATGLLDKIEDEKKRTEWAIKIKKTITDNTEKITDNADTIYADKADGKTLAEQVDRLNQSLDRYIPKLDISKREYEIEIPRKGNYSLFINELTNSRIEELKNWELEIDGEKIADNALNADKADRKTDNADGGWREWGEINLEEGKHILLLRSNADNADNKIQTTRIKSADNVDGRVAIAEWRNNQWYQVKGKLIEETKIGQEKIIIEQKDKEEEEKKEEAEWKEIKMYQPNENEFTFYFKSGDSSELGRLILENVALEDFENLSVRPVWEPEIVLRSKTADNADKKDADEKTWIPKITFVKINPTKYRIKVEGAKEPYTLVFSESFHEGWKIYADKADKENTDNADRSADKADEKYGEEVASYFDGQVKEGTHRNTFLEPATFETWGKEPIAQDNHLLVNGYANSWYITPNDVDGAENYELIVEFWPQRLFYIGLFISGLTLVGSLGYLTISLIMRIRKHG